MITNILHAIALALAPYPVDHDDMCDDGYHGFPEPEGWRAWWYFAGQEAWERWADRTHAMAGRDYDDEFPMPPRLSMFWMTLELIVHDWFTSTFHPLLWDYCQKFGHGSMDDHGWCNPDTGGEAWSCRRCGESWSHTYF